MIEKTYNPQAIEQHWYQSWESNGYFAPGGGDNPYCIMIPPPNVTGTLHMGHGFNNTIMDALIRYHRMKGDNTLWQPGTDHAGIATQMVVERQLAAEGQSRHDLGREQFIERVWEWKGESGGNITRQLRRMGASLDWDSERFTMDEGLSAAVREVFVRLYEDGLIYRGKRLVNWDPVLHTAVSDLEVVSEEESGHFWHMRYPLADGSGYLEVATTRPETMLGDSAVAVHPEDGRYQHLIGQRVRLPLCDREIPIIADDYVDPEFGTGCVKITPAHDFNDYAIGQRHGLEMINIFTVNASINENAPERYRGMDRYEARDLIVQDLHAEGLLVKIDDHKLMVPRGDRSGSVIEPLLTDQWFVDLTKKIQEDGRPGGFTAITQPALDCVSDGSIKFIPGNWVNTYNQWLENIQDWCISRQIWWGHRIPAWYDADGTIYVGRDEAEVRQKHNLGSDVVLSQDEDVLDTWFSSALWPFSTLGWPDASARVETFYPSAVLVTGFDIIFFWVARMVMMGNYFMQQVPFREVYIHGLVRDSHGQKMSKSKGNVLDPIDLIDGIDLEALVAKRTKGMMQPQMAKKIEQQTRKEFPDGITAYGTDALRFTFASLASLGRDINFDLGRIEGYRNFCNKLWNASRYVMMNLEGEPMQGEAQLSTADRWIISRLQRTEEQVATAIDGYRFDLAAQAIYEFSWNSYCDWYLELVKPVLIGDSSDALKLGARQTLARVLETILRLTHPIMPYLTEEIWQKVAPLADVQGSTTIAGGMGPGATDAQGVTASIMLQPYPEADATLIDEGAEQQMAWVMEFIGGVRKIRSGMNIKPSQPLPLLLQNHSGQDRDWYAANAVTITTLAKIESVRWLAVGEETPESATSLLGELQILVPMAGLIDKRAELDRLSKEIDRLEKECQRLRSKLSNDKFVSKAPAEVVEVERSKLADAEGALSQLLGQRSSIEKM